MCVCVLVNFRFVEVGSRLNHVLSSMRWQVGQTKAVVVSMAVGKMEKGAACTTNKRLMLPWLDQQPKQGGLQLSRARGSGSESQLLAK
jgi:hypothetical protein